MARIISIFTMAFLMAVLARPADLGAGPLKNRSQIGLRIGAFMDTGGSAASSAPVVVSTAGTGDLLAGVFYGRWLEENFAITFSVSALDAGVRNTLGTSGVSNSVNSVVFLMLGMKYYLPKSTYKTAYRPYLAAGVGPVFWSGVLNEAGFSGIVHLTETMAAFGSHFGGGVDIELSRHLMIGANLGYNLLSDFSGIKVGKNNYSGFEFGIGLSFLWGKGVQTGN